MRNDIINYATGKPVSCIDVYYDKLVKEGCLKNVKILECLCYILCGKVYNSCNFTNKEAVCKIFQEIADTLSIPFQDVFDLWNGDRILLRTKKTTLVLGAVTNSIFNQYADGKTIYLYFVHEETETPLLGSFVFEPELKYGVATHPSWLAFLKHIDNACSLISADFVNRRSSTYNTKILAKSLLNISNKQWKEIVKGPVYVLLQDLQDNTVSRLTELMKAIPDYEIDIWLLVCIAQDKPPYTKDTDKLFGCIAYHLAKVINEGKLRKVVKIKN
jgi:hypothetical protein